jgi:hypothetical protein
VKKFLIKIWEIMRSGDFRKQAEIEKRKRSRRSKIPVGNREFQPKNSNIEYLLKKLGIFFKFVLRNHAVMSSFTDHLSFRNFFFVLNWIKPKKFLKKKNLFVSFI